MPEHLLEVENLTTAFAGSHDIVRAVDGVTLTVERGERIAVVGESGCGKTVLALSILGLLPDGARIVGGRIRFAGVDLLALDEGLRRRMRGRRLAMTFQDPMPSLNPLMRVGSQLREAMLAHERFTPREADERVVPLLKQLRVPDAAVRARDYPHQLSGGMRQRVLLAMGLSNEPELLIADEATSALDVTAQAEVVRLLARLSTDLGTAVVMITHNLALAAGACDRVVVMHAGKIVEDGPMEQLFVDPRHPYTWHLLRSAPRPRSQRRSRLATIPGAPPDLARVPPGCAFHPRCPFGTERCALEVPVLDAAGPGRRVSCWAPLASDSGEHDRLAGSEPVEAARTRPAGADGGEILRVEQLSKHFATPLGPLRAVDGVSFTVRRGETLGLIGESGCGKSTLARLIARLTEPTGGRILFEGKDLFALKGSALRQVRQRLQVVFQDPFSSLDPRLTVERTVAEPLRNFGAGRAQSRQEVRGLLDMVGLPASAATRYPHELSGGQRQRVGIARALSVRPSVVICDEPLSSLDAPIQAQILNLLQDLQDDLGLTYVFISHDLGVVQHVSDRIAVMYLGKLVEVASGDDLFAHPQHPYTKAFIDALPVLDPRREQAQSLVLLADEPPSPVAPPAGCRFHPRCPIAQVPAPCSTEDPELVPHRPQHLAACHLAGQLGAGAGQPAAGWVR